MGYVAQNAGRIARSLQDIAMSRKWSQATASLLNICKAVESMLEDCTLYRLVLIPPFPRAPMAVVSSPRADVPFR